MRHPAGPEIQAWIDGEAADADVAALTAHVDACPRCAALAAEFRARAETLSLAVLEVDGAEPAHWRARGALPLGLPTARRSTVSRALHRAAVVFLAVTGAAAASIIGRDLIAGRSAVPEAGAGDVAVRPAGAPAVAGVLMNPVADSVTIEVEGAGPGARLQVRVSGRADVSVNVEGGSATPRIRVDAQAGRILVDMGGGGGLVAVEVPASLRSAVVRTDGRAVVRFADGRIDPAAAESGVPLGS